MDLQNRCPNQKKNTVDPEEIINNYGADSVRLFILSDSPPEKDVQWSVEGIISSYKFIQKLWNLNLKINHEIKKNHPLTEDDQLIKFTNQFIKKVTQNLNSFSYNILIANLPFPLGDQLALQLATPVRRAAVYSDRRVEAPHKIAVVEAVKASTRSVGGYRHTKACRTLGRPSTRERVDVSLREPRRGSCPRARLRPRMGRG